jgi:RNA polymerase sigma-70 factor (ECF subfamily)
MTAPAGVTAAFGNPTDEARFAALYRRHYRPVRDYCRRRVDRDLVDDVVAETFLAVWHRIAEVPSEDEALPWIYAVAYRVVGHQWRANTRRRRLEDRLRTLRSRHVPAVDELAIDDAEYRLVLAATAQLADRDAEVLRLAAWERLSTDAIAAILGIEPNAVKQRLHRARQHLARHYRRLASHPTPSRAPSTGGVR